MIALGHRGLVLAGCLLLAAAPVSNAAGLPWPDANPLERLLGKPKQQPTQGAKPRRQSQVRPAPAAVPVIADVPLPDARPEQPDAANKVVETPDENAEAAPPPELAEPDASPAVPAADTVPTPETAPPTPDAPAADANPAPSDGTSPEPSPAPPEVKTPPPSETAKRPIDEIPTPVDRPEGEGTDAPEAVTSPEPARPEPAPPAVAEPEPAKPEPTKAQPEPAAPAPVEPDPAPNSTENLKSRSVEITPAASVLAAAAVEDAKLCEDELTQRGIEFTVGESISEGECGVLRPIDVKRLSSGVRVLPNTQFLCRTALALDDWMTKGVLPAVKADLPGRKLTEFRHASTYVCRPRASESAISEHARGSAIDIASFVFDTGEDIGVAAQAEGSPEAKFQAAVRSAACGPFLTVLGPGSDSNHATHFHLDIAARRNGATYCK
ncbi:hypothetical protein Sa4125_36240 [Aureimonas sp. SA4125]|uniref:extensin-like domain-containing protein n=1 Tax=Aureimonas sp. SA4125 TaxID=2826993 RepID=UPI001CC54B4D|nr:extensin family protein [Aureimonas sp. SA4125]BDA86082.1 hypothetical protein Sa4125_36240 [Aureimonas sp. SA4125]